MFALCAISMIRIFSFAGGGDTSAVFYTERPSDTVFIRAQRLDFLTVGRAVRELQSGSSDKKLTDILFGSGVFFKQYGVAGSSTISRRGADANQTQVNWNGLPINNPMLGMSDFNTLVGWGTGEVFLVEGGNSASVGSGSMGGTVFMRNGLSFKEKRDNLGDSIFMKGGHGSFSHKSKLLLSLGSFGERNIAAEAIASNENSYLGFAVGNFYSVNSFDFNDLGLDLPKRKMENAVKFQQMMRCIGGVKSGKHQWKSVVEWMGMSRQLGLSLGSMQLLGKQLDQNARAVLEHQVQRGRRWTVLQRLGGVIDEINYFSSPNDSLGSKSVAKTLHFQNEVYYQLGMFRFLLGGDFQLQVANSDYYLGWSRRALPATLLGVYWSQKKWSAVGNARYEWNEKVPTAGLSLQYQASRRVACKSNVHSSFRRPTANDLFWISGASIEPLKPEKGRGAEVGLVYQMGESLGPKNSKQKSNPSNAQSRVNPPENAFSMKAEITFYYRELDFPILWVPSGAVWRAMNLSGGGRYAGAQLYAKTQYTINKSALQLAMNLDRVSSKVKQSVSSQEYQQIFVPDWNGDVSLGLFTRKFSSGLVLQHVGNRFIQTDNRAFLPSYKLLNCYLNAPEVISWNRQTAKNSSSIALDFTFEILNALATNYVSMPGRPMPGRSFKVGLLIHYN